MSIEWTEDQKAFLDGLKRQTGMAERQRKAAEQAAPEPLKLVSSTEKPAPPMDRLANARARAESDIRTWGVEAGALKEIEVPPRGREGSQAAAEQAMRALVARKAEVYQRAGRLVQPMEEEGENGRGEKIKVASLVEMGPGALEFVLKDHLRLVLTSNRSGKQYLDPGTTRVPRLILDARSRWPFSTIAGLANAATLRKDGSVVQVPGFDPGSHLLLKNLPPMPMINARPSRAEGEEALALLKELLSEFNFVDLASEAVALSLILSVLIRSALDFVPMHIVSAPAAGSGKSYLIDLGALIATGQDAAVVAASGNPQETEKKLASVLMMGRTLIPLDNCNGEIGSDLMCQAITQPMLQMRTFGKLGEDVSIPNRFVIVATGINITAIDDLTRRTLLCRLDTDLESPWKHPYKKKPKDKILADRGRYIAAALTVVLAYLAAGEPEVEAERVNGFERWSRFVQAPLVWLGEADPVATMAAVREGDPKLQASIAALIALEDMFGLGEPSGKLLSQVMDEVAGTTGASVAAVLDAPMALHERRKALREALMAVAGVGKEINQTKLTYWLRRIKGQIMSGRRLCNGPAGKHKTKWWVERV